MRLLLLLLNELIDDALMRSVFSDLLNKQVGQRDYCYCNVDGNNKEVAIFPPVSCKGCSCNHLEDSSSHASSAIDDSRDERYRFLIALKIRLLAQVSGDNCLNDVVSRVVCEAQEEHQGEELTLG